MDRPPRKSSLPPSTSASTLSPPLSTSSPPDTPGPKTPQSLPPTSLPSEKNLLVASNSGPLSSNPSSNSHRRSLSNSKQQQRLPPISSASTPSNSNNSNGEDSTSFNFSEDPKATISSAAAAITRSDSSSFDRYKTGSPTSPSMPKSLIEAEEALGLTERVQEEEEKDRRRRQEMDLRRSQNSARSAASGGGGRAGQEDVWAREGDGRERDGRGGGELRAPQPRYVGREGSDTGYDSDSRSVFGSYDPDVRGTRIFEEEDDEEMEVVSRGLSNADRTPQAITFEQQQPRRPSDTSSVPLPLKHQRSAAHPVSPLSKNQQLPTPPLGIAPPPQRSYEDELRPPTPTLRRSQSAEHSVAYQPSPYPSRSQQQYDPRDGRGQQQQHRGERERERGPRWQGANDRDRDQRDFPTSPQGMYVHPRDGSDYSLPQRSTSYVSQSGGDPYYQQQQQNPRYQHQQHDSYYRTDPRDRDRGRVVDYFPTTSSQFPLPPPIRDRYGSLPSPSDLYDEGLPTPTASSGSNFGSSQQQQQQQGVVARVQQREEATLPASFFGASPSTAVGMRGGQRSMDPRFPGHKSERSESFYTASEDGMGGALSLGGSSVRAEPEAFKGPFSNFPNLKDGTRVDGKTSLPITFIQRDLDHSISSLISKDVFNELLDDPMGRFRFREWLAREGKPKSSSLLAFYQDSKAYLKIMDEFKSLGLAIHESFLAPSSVKEIDVSTESKEDSLLALREAHRLKTPFSRAATQAFDTLYASEFSAFIKKKITDQARVRLGMFTAQQERGDLGDVFCLTNPRLPDHPIVMCSDGFIRLTGYPRNQLVGRNCRFLQGPSTNPESVQNLRDALNAGVPSCELLLNYKADGTAFWNCLTMIPLKASSGRVDYFLGGQINISGALASRQSLSFLVGASSNDSTMSSVEDQHAINLAKSGNADLELSPEVVSAVERQIGHQSHLRAKESLGPGERPGGAVAAGLVQDNDTAGRVGGFGSTSPVGISKFFSKLRGKTTLPGVFSADGQRISGAEGMLGTQALPLDEQMAKFTEVYSKVFLFRTKKLEVIFVTPALLAYLGFSVASPKKMYASPLLHQDFTDLLCLPTRRETAELKKNVRKIVQTEAAHSLRGGIRLSSKVRGARSAAVSDAVTEEGVRVTLGLMHLTPLKDQKGYVEAWACVFGG